MCNAKLLWLVVVVVVAGLILEHGCTKSSESLVIDRFPAKVGNAWEYSRSFSIVVYDTVNNDTTAYLVVDSLHEEFEGIDTLAGWECYRLDHTLYEQGDTIDQYYWYAHPDSALLWVAYTPDDTSPILTRSMVKGNIRFRFGEMMFNSPQALAYFLHSIRHKSFQNLGTDTSYWSTPRKLFIYPLKLGKSWTAMTDPWIEEREAVDEDSISVPAGTFFTLRIEINSDMMDANVWWSNWVSEEGVVKDSFYCRDDATDFEGQVIGYYDLYDTYELIYFNIEE